MDCVARMSTSEISLRDAEARSRDEGMILASPEIRAAHRHVVEAAIRGIHRLVLIGPTGSGKERLAGAYHAALERNGPLVPINCGALSRDRIVADLFGAEAGAYTGATRTLVGAVERAEGGTLFLDEVGEIPLDVQPALLRFLDSGEYQRLGALGASRRADVHVVAATNRDLRELVKVGAFRADLFFRLGLDVVIIPGLVERPADVLAYLGQEHLGAASACSALQPIALKLVLAHGWEGNFRELAGFVRRLPRPSTIGSIGRDAAAEALAAGMLFPPPQRAGGCPSEDGWIGWLRMSAAAFESSNRAGGPTTWAELTDYVERYLKPHAVAHMGAVGEARTIEEVTIARLAEELRADRGTVLKQLKRYFESAHRRETGT